MKLVALIGLVVACKAGDDHKQPPAQIAPAPAAATPSPPPPKPPAPALDVCAAGTRAFEHATCSSDHGRQVLEQAKKTVTGTLDLTKKAANADPQSLQLVCAQLIQALIRDTSAQGCKIELDPSDQQQIDQLLKTYYAQRTPVTKTGDADADAVVARAAAVRDQLCACEDLKCVDKAEKAIDSIGTFGSNAPQAARDLGAKLLDDVSRCVARLKTPATK